MKAITAQQAAGLVEPGMSLGLSGFTTAGAPKLIPDAIAERFAQNPEGRFSLFTGASMGHTDDVLTPYIEYRAPFQSSPTFQAAANSGTVGYQDMHLSDMARRVRTGVIPIDIAIVEACYVDSTSIGLTTSIGSTDVFINQAKHGVIIELNQSQPAWLPDLHDIPRSLGRKPVNLHNPLSRIGFRTVPMPKNLLGIVETNVRENLPSFSNPTEESKKISGHVAAFLRSEIQRGGLDPDYLVFQSGVGNIQNAILEGLGDDDRIPSFSLYSEVFQDSMVPLLEKGRIKGISSTALSLSSQYRDRFFDGINDFRNRVVLRPVEISNHPAPIRQFDVVAMNTAIEMDVTGNVNSSHIGGVQIKNGLGGSGDFARNALISIFAAPSTAKKGAISSIVPHVSHMDHSEHSVDVIVTENGLADLRNTTPRERSRAIIEQCAHPKFRDDLWRYLKGCPSGHTPFNLNTCYSFHERLTRTGSMVA